jgi:hypothetical protein
MIGNKNNNKIIKNNNNKPKNEKKEKNLQAVYVLRKDILFLHNFCDVFFALNLKLRNKHIEQRWV